MKKRRLINADAVAARLSIIVVAMMLLSLSDAVVCGQPPAKPDPSAPQSVRNESLRRELIAMMREDQAARESMLKKLGEAGIPFQKKCLKLMEAAPKGDVDGADVAYLTDRVLVGENKPQRYGTQIDAGFKPFPIEDEKNVDKRREARGLAPLAQYLGDAREAYEKYQGKKAGGK